MTQERQPNTNQEGYTVSKRKAKYGAGVILAATLALGGAYALGSVNTGKAEANGSTPSAEATPRVAEAGATPTPEVEGSTPSASVEPSETPENGVAYSQAGHYELGSTAIVKTGDILIGDIKMADLGSKDYVRLFDMDTDKRDGVTDNAKTGLITVVKEDAEVYFKYGGDIVNVDADKQAMWLEDQKKDMANGGCGPEGCNQGVDIVEWSGLDSTITQSGKSALEVQAMDNANGEVSVNPSSETPTVAEVPTITENDLTGKTVDEKRDIILKILQDGKIDVSTPEGRAIFDLLLDCLCPTVPTKTVEPTPSVDCPVVSDDKVMKMGETKTFNDVYGIIGQGDLNIKIGSGPWKRYYDDSAKTAGVNVRWFGKETDVRIKAPVGGADIIFYLCPDKKAFDTKVKEVKEATLDTGRTIDRRSLGN